MNHILRLQRDLRDKEHAILATQEAILAFKAHLHGPKFSGVESDGSRKDWISTADVLSWLENIAQKTLETGRQE